MLKRILFGLTLFCSCLPILAQEVDDADKDRQYVTDQLRLSLYENASSQSQVIKLLQSGDLLVIDEISGPYALVTAPDGTRGWVKRGFLVTKPTSNLLLQEEQQKTSELAAEIEKLANSKVVIDQYEKDMDKLVEKIDELESTNQTANETIAQLQSEVEARQLELDRKLEDNTPAMVVLMDVITRYWQIIAPVLVVLLLISFLISKQVVEARIKAKFHGIKIW